jgi:hypothetical protein
LTWTGGGPDTNWSTPSNWTPAGPPNPGDSVTLSGLPTIVMDIDGDLLSLTASATSNFTSAGGVLGIGAGGLTRNAGNLTFDSTMAIVLTASQTWSILGGANTMAGNLIGPGVLLTKTGVGSFTFSVTTPARRDRLERRDALREQRRCAVGRVHAHERNAQPRGGQRHRLRDLHRR